MRAPLVSSTQATKRVEPAKVTSAACKLSASCLACATKWSSQNCQLGQKPCRGCVPRSTLVGAKCGNFLQHKCLPCAGGEIGGARGKMKRSKKKQMEGGGGLVAKCKGERSKKKQDDNPNPKSQSVCALSLPRAKKYNSSLPAMVNSCSTLRFVSSSMTRTP